MKLTLPQQDVYFEQLMYPEEPIYNIGAKIAIAGEISLAKMNAAYVALINQHDTYRAVLQQQDGKSILHIQSTHDSELEFLDFSSFKKADKKAIDFMQNDFETPFDLDSEKLLHRFKLIKVKENYHYLYSVYHHLITDGWGTSLMFQRLVKNYNELIQSDEITSSYPFSYEEFVKDDEAYFDSEDFQKDQSYWSDRFQHLPERLFEKIEEHTQKNKSDRQELIISRAQYNLLAAQAKTCKCSTFHVLLGVLFLYFFRKHQNEDFAIGLPVLNRGKSVFKKTVGLFMGISALRLQINPKNTFEELVQQIRQQLRQDYRSQRFPLGKLIQNLEAFGEKDRLFNISLSYEKQNYSDHFWQTQTKVIPLSHNSERVALAVYIREFDELEDVKIDFDYNLNYFTKESITQVVSHFNVLLSQVVGDPSRPLIDYSYLTNKEEKRILFEFNHTQVIWEKNNDNLLNHFALALRKQPDAIALSDKNHRYTYHKVATLSDQVAKYLVDNLDSKENDPVAVLINRSADLIVTLLGVLKSGRAFIPLDPDFPQERINHIIEHSGVRCIISDEKKEDARYHCLKTILNTELPIDIVPKLTIKSSTTAYIIYTSGSTGKPKGVEISHGALINFLLSIQKKPGITDQDLLLSVTTQSFDISILEFFVPLLSGASLHVADRTLLNNPIAFLDELEAVNPTIIQATPSFYQMLFNAGWKGNSALKILCGGDLLSESLATKLLNSTQEVWNMYGPTETTIWSSIKPVVLPTDASNIGRPIDNTSFYILDNFLKPLPIGVPGNIYIGGKGLAKGYYKNDTLTQEKFIQSPFSKTERIYETGDLGQWTNDGEIEFLGRNDNQVKIRGYRIELGEIEMKLNELKEVSASVVVAKKKKDQEALLMAFVNLNNQDADLNVLLGELKKVLPAYMIPYAVIPLDQFPLTPNKKVDRKKLSEYKIEGAVHSEEGSRSLSAMEKRLAGFYQKILETSETIQPSSNFFSLGGHSLNAVKLIALVSQEMGCQLSLKSIFDNPTIERLANYLESGEVMRSLILTRIGKQDYYEINTAQYGIWLASQQSERSIAYNMSATFAVDGPLDAFILKQAFSSLIEKYEILRTSFVEQHGEIYQRIGTAQEFTLNVIKRTFKQELLEAEIQAFLNQEFDLKNGPLLRTGIFMNEQQETYFLFCTHHIIMDGWSLEVLIKELVEIYGTIASQKLVVKESLDFQFKDFCAWQNKIEAGSSKKNRSFWQQYLREFQWENASFVRDNYAASSSNVVRQVLNLDETLLVQLLEFSKAHQVSLHTFLVSTFNILLFKTYGPQDFCIGTINAGRSLAAMNTQLGMFVKTLPLRSNLNTAMTFEHYQEQIQQDLLQMDNHQDLPEEVQHKMRLEVIFALQNQSFDFEEIVMDQSIVLKSIGVIPKYNRVPLLINFAKSADGLKGIFDFDPTKFSEDDIELLLMKYERVLKIVVANPEMAIGDLDTELQLENDQAVEISFDF